MPTLWALLVGIRNYPLQDWPPAAGAHSDLRNVFKYLTHDMNTPQEHILRLQDDAATREGIISTFKSHLIDNPKISRGDALLFYYSGHGSYVKAPTGWTIVKSVGDDRSDDMIEVILPYDENAPNSHDGSPTCAIPDRTLAALLDAAAAKHGRNITVILDCCSSGHGTRADTRLQLDGEDLISRDIDPSRLTQLPADLDHDLVAQLNPEQPDAGVHVNNRRGRFPALGANHVLLAACKPREQAQGTDGFGGILTTLWLSAMRNKSVRPRTYANVTRYINNVLDQLLRDKNILWEQHPQCEGSVRERIVFEETIVQAEYFPAVLTATTGQLEVETGEVHAVEKDVTEFEVYGLDESLKGEKLCTARAINVGMRNSIIQILDKESVPTTFSTYAATIIQKPALKYTIRGNPANYTEATKATYINLLKALKSAQEIQEAIDEDEADLEISFDGQGAIYLQRFDDCLRNLCNPVPCITAREIESAQFDKIFGGIAKFNFHLSLTNRTHPFAEKVTFDMLRFAETNGGGAHGVFPLREVDGRISRAGNSIGYEVTDEDEYAIVLCNNTEVDLYVQVWYFDPDVYSIEALYEPASDAEATLPKDGGQLQIGGSTELAWPLTYYVPDGPGIERSTLFAKVYLTTQPVRLRSLQQGDLIGPNAMDDRGELQGEIETKGWWDTIVQPITVVKGRHTVV